MYRSHVAGGQALSSVRAAVHLRNRVFGQNFGWLVGRINALGSS
jgi:hypothetical protein